MNKIYFEVGDNVVIKHTPIPEIGENIYKTEVVITKETFQECYKKWVEPQEKYCDRNICIKNEYNGIGCDECEVTKSRETRESEEQGWIGYMRD